MTTTVKAAHATNAAPAKHETPVKHGGQGTNATLTSIASETSHQTNAIPATPATIEATPIAATTALTVAPTQNLIFPLVLTIAAVFPVAIGLGVVGLKASTSPAGTIASTNARTRHHADEKRPPTPRPVDRRIGDQQFQERRYEVALQYYQSLSGADPARLPPELAYRIALCQESLGLWKEAQDGFQAVCDATDNSVLNAAASLARARLWIRLKEPAKAESQLRSMVFRSGSFDSFPKEMLREIEFLIPLSQTQVAVSIPPHHMTRDEPSLVADTLDWPLESALDWGNVPMRVDVSIANAISPDNILSCRVVRSTSQTANAPSFEDWRGDFCCHNQTLQTILERLADECDWSLDLSDVSNARPIDRVVNFNAKNFPVCLLLASICSELQSSWTLEENRLTIVRTDAHSDCSHRMISRTLTSLVHHTPDHRLVRHARFALAQLAQLDEQFSDAANLFSSLVGRDSSPLSIRAAYNAATNYYRIGDFSRACVQLGYVVDGAPERELQVEALLLYGRLLLDCGENQDAEFQLRRAAESKNRPMDQARAAVLLGLSLLVQDKFNEAAEAIFAHRTQFQDSSVRNGAAFVTAFARWRALKGERQEREATYLYRSLLSIKSDSAWLGLTGQLLIGRAFGELGFEDQMAEVYSPILCQNVPDKIRHEVTFSLAEYELSNGHPERATEILGELMTEKEDVWTNRARLKLAEIAYSNGDFQDCLENCRLLLHRTGIASGDIQKLMGRSYERMGDDIRAAKSYAGQIPAP